MPAIGSERPVSEIPSTGNGSISGALGCQTIFCTAANTTTTQSTTGGLFFDASYQRF